MKKRIMIADDNEMIRVLLENYLGNEYDVSSYPDGEYMLESLSKGHVPDLIIADVNMPNLDGWKLINNLKVSLFFRNIPIIMLSGIEKSQERIKYLKFGVADFVLKPFNPEELRVIIHNILKNNRHAY